MPSRDPWMYSIFALAVILTLVIGIYSILTTRNLIRLLIGLEVLTKGATLLLIVGGRYANRLALAQALAITLIVVEVAVIVVAVALVLCIHRRTDSIDTSTLRNIKG